MGGHETEFIILYDIRRRSVVRRSRFQIKQKKYVFINAPGAIILLLLYQIPNSYRYCASNRDQGYGGGYDHDAPEEHASSCGVDSVQGFIIPNESKSKADRTGLFVPTGLVHVIIVVHAYTS